MNLRWVLRFLRRYLAHRAINVKGCSKAPALCEEFKWAYRRGRRAREERGE